MSKKLVVVLLAMLVLVGAMGLKTAITVRGSDSVVMANGTSPFPKLDRNGTSPFPTGGSARNGTSPFPTGSY